MSVGKHLLPRDTYNCKTLVVSCLENRKIVFGQQIGKMLHFYMLFASQKIGVYMFVFQFIFVIL